MTDGGANAGGANVDDSVAGCFVIFLLGNPQEEEEEDTRQRPIVAAIAIRK